MECRQLLYVREVRIGSIVENAERSCEVQLNESSAECGNIPEESLGAGEQDPGKIDPQVFRVVLAIVVGMEKAVDVTGNIFRANCSGSVS